LAATAAAAGWFAVALLGRLSETLGGGVLGVLLSAAIVAGSAYLLFLLARWLSARASVRRALDREPKKKEPGAKRTSQTIEQRAWDEAHEEATQRLRADGRRIHAAGERIVRRHPYSGLIASAGAGFLATLLLPVRTALRGAGRRGAGLARGALWTLLSRKLGRGLTLKLIEHLRGADARRKGEASPAAHVGNGRH
jgi:hypothetical protein